MSRLLSLEDVAMNAEEHAKFQQLLAAYDQALRLQRMRERTIETYRQYLGLAEFCLQDFRLAKGESLGPHAQAVVTTVLLLEAD
jgi:hypothetical protein